MKKAIILFALILILAAVFMGCSSKSIQEPPELSINIRDKEIEYISAKNKWNGYVYDREDSFVTLLMKQKDIPIFEHGSVVEIAFESNPPDKFTVADILVNENGHQIYTEKEIKYIPVELNDGKCSFIIEKHFASYLSSSYEPDKIDIRGFRMIASWGENECEYAFVIKTNSIIKEIDRSEYITGEIITESIKDRINFSDLLLK